MKILLSKKTSMILLLICSLYLASTFYVFNYTIDDAFISLRYAENLVNTGHLTYNPGEAPQEGYTNFLLILIEAFFFKLGLGDMVIFVPKIIGIVSGILTIFYTFKLTNLIILDFGNEKPGWIPYLPPLATALSIPFIVWSGAGLETVLFTALIVAAIFYYFKLIVEAKLHNGYISEGLFFASVLCRPEGLLFWGLSYAFAFIYHRRYPLKNKIKTGIPIFLFLGTYLIWKILYFGDAIPLTFYAKNTGLLLDNVADGFTRLAYFLSINVNYVHIALFIFFTVVSIQARHHKTYFIFMCVFIYALWIIHFGATMAMDDCFRLYVPLIPLFYISSGLGIYYLQQYIPKLNTSILTVLLIIFSGVQVVVSIGNLNTAWDKDCNFGAKTTTEYYGLSDLIIQWNALKDMGLWLRNNVSPDTSVAVGDIGMIGYYSKLKIIDTYSLVNKPIVLMQKEMRNFPPASPTNGKIRNKIRDYIFQQKPDILVSSSVELVKDPRISGYTPTQPEDFTCFGKSFKLYFHNELIDKYNLKEFIVNN